MKKKIILVSLISILLIAGLFILTGCGNKEQSSNNENYEKNSSNNTSESSQLTNVLLGEWSFDTSTQKDGTNTTLVFNSDLSGEMIQAGDSYKFTYEFTESKVTFTYEILGKTEQSYNIDGDILTLTNSYGENAKYKRIK